MIICCFYGLRLLYEFTARVLRRTADYFDGGEKMIHRPKSIEPVLKVVMDKSTQVNEKSFSVQFVQLRDDGSVSVLDIYRFFHIDDNAESKRFQADQFHGPWSPIIPTDSQASAGSDTYDHQRRIHSRGRRVDKAIDTETEQREVVDDEVYFENTIRATERTPVTPEEGLGGPFDRECFDPRQKTSEDSRGMDHFGTPPAVTAEDSSSTGGNAGIPATHR